MALCRLVPATTVSLRWLVPDMGKTTARSGCDLRHAPGPRLAWVHCLPSAVARRAASASPSLANDMIESLPAQAKELVI